MANTFVELEVSPVISRADLKAFMKLPWRIYKNDPQWVPPLLGELEKVLDKRKHPYHQHADSALFLARRNGEVVGRIGATVNHLYNEFHESKTGYFAFFESIDDVEVARALLDTAFEWNAQRGMTLLMGPMNWSTNEEFCSPGVLVDGFDSSPAVLMGHTPQYYSRLLEECGFSKSKDLLCYWLQGDEPPERLVKGVARIKKAQNIVIRSLNMKDMDGEIARIKEIYNAAWERNWGFVPMTEAEFEHMAKSIKPIINPNLCQLAEIDGKPVGFILELPDYNKAFKHMNGRMFPIGWAKFLWHKRKIDSVRVITLGVTPAQRGKGIESMLMVSLYLEGLKHGFPRGECSWILEDNLPMRHAMERSGAYVYKTYRVYEKLIAAL